MLSLSFHASNCSFAPKKTGIRIFPHPLWQMTMGNKAESSLKKQNLTIVRNMV